MKFSKTAFEALAEKALAEIPRPFLDLLHNLEIDVQDAPGPEAGSWNGSKTLLGLYKGLNRAEMLSTNSGTHPPARIILYQDNIQAGCPSDRELMKAIRTTLRHELAHHFGFSDEDLKEKWPEGA